ncbi:MAG: hypothetical protein VKM01_04955 [Cyanobacteriota bacterium]|nr:hypothetical protein [Cyanobacteriota bacterium]
MDRFPDRSRRPLSRRFLSPEDRARTLPPRRGQAWGLGEMFADGQWQAIRVVLEGEGWNLSQIERMHEQLRQGWSLAMARRNVAAQTGSCPLKAQRQA